MRTKELWRFICERENVRLKKESGAQRPWTKDVVLAKYRFCNVHRENDRTTKTLAKLVRSATLDAWFAIVVSRLLNNPASVWVARATFIKGWRPEDFVRVLHHYRDGGNKIFNAAYMIRCDANMPNSSKIVYLAERVLTPMWKTREALRPRAGDTLQSLHERLAGCYGLGGFIAGQVIGDLKFCNPHLKKAEDWWTWAASGPGSRRGLNRVYWRPIDTPWRERDWKDALDILKESVDTLQAKSKIAPISAQDLQNCLCEFDKYERALTGQGKPKQLYKPF